MNSSFFSGKDDLLQMRELIRRLGSRSTTVDFEENLQLSQVRATTRLWRHDGLVIGFAYVDDFNNLWFDMDAQASLVPELTKEIFDWGIVCLRAQNTNSEKPNKLDCSCSMEDSSRVDLLLRHGFIPEEVRTLEYEQSLDGILIEHAMPVGFSIRCANGREEVEQLVALHRAAFKTDKMSTEYRLAMMGTPQYQPELDLIAVTSDGGLAAFCVCGFDDPEKTIGYTDPIGTHPRYQRRGLAKAVLSAGLIALKGSGAKVAGFSTSSDNVPMRKLAEAMGFLVISEKAWFTKSI